jgi:hypothetical protein
MVPRPPICKAANQVWPVRKIAISNNPGVAPSHLEGLVDSSAVYDDIEGLLSPERGRLAVDRVDLADKLGLGRCSMTFASFASEEVKMMFGTRGESDLGAIFDC